MKRFSIGTSIGDGFGLVTGRPLSVFVWGLLLLAPVIGCFALVLPMMGQVLASMPAAEAASTADEAFTEQMFAATMQFQLASMLINVCQLVLAAIVYTAVFRAVLRPAERGFFSLRLGMDELRVAVVGLAIGVVLYIAMIVLALIGAALIFALWSTDPTLGGWALAIYGLLALVGVFWALARVSMMAPASVLHRDFAFVQGWRLASGKGWSLLGMMFVIVLLILAIEIVLVLIGALAFSGVWATVGSTLIADSNPIPGLNAWLTANWYWVVLAGLVGSFFYGALLALTVGPFASACRQLSDSDRSTDIAVEAGSPAPAQ